MLKWPTPKRNIFPLAVTIITAVFCLVYLRVGISRVFYPYALDLVEEGIVMQSWRVAQGLPVFVPLNGDFVPQVYMPLFTTLAGGIMRWVGFGFWPMRLLSFIATLTTAVLLFVIGRRECRNSHIAFWGAGLFLAGYRLVGGWYDLGRVDALFLVLSLGAIAAAVYGNHSNRWLFFSGFLMGLSVMTKQNGLLFAGLIGSYLIWRAGRRTWLYATAFILTAVLPILTYEWASGGWFSYYVVDIAYINPLEPIRVWHTITRELLGGMGLLLMMLCVEVIIRWQQEGWRPFLTSPWPVLAGAAVFISLAGRSSVGGNANNLIPGYGLLCLSPALLSIELRKRPLIYWLIPLVVLGQFTLTLFNPIPNKPARFLPTADMRAAGDAMVEMVRQNKGPVWVMMHPSINVMAGKEPEVHVQTLWHARRRGQLPIPADLEDRIRNQEFNLIVSDESAYFEDEPALLSLLERYYHLDRYLTDGESPSTLSGPVIRPLAVYFPRK